MSVQRIADLRKKVQAANLDGMIIADLDQVRYLAGYTGSNGLLVITDKTALFLTDFRYTEQAKKEVKGAKVNIMKTGDLVAGLAEFPGLNRRNMRKRNQRGQLPNCIKIAGYKRCKCV